MQDNLDIQLKNWTRICCQFDGQFDGTAKRLAVG